MDHIAGRQEQQRLEAGMVDRMEERSPESDERQRTEAVTLQHQTGTDPESNDADVLDR